MKVDEGLVRPSVEQIDLRRMMFNTGAIIQQVEASVDCRHDRCFSKTLSLVLVFVRMLMMFLIISFILLLVNSRKIRQYAQMNVTCLLYS